MRRQWIYWFATFVVGVGLSGAWAQQNDRSQAEQQEQNQSRAASNEDDRDRESDQRARENQQNDNEIRLRYDDEKDRLSIDVDEDIKFRNDESKRDVTRDGQFDLRYDTDRHDLKASGEGTIDVDRAATQIAHWWQSWWRDEKNARRDRNESSTEGARQFIRDYDDDDDAYLSRSELPSRMRDDFSQVDRNRDGYLSRRELQQYGESILQSEHAGTRRSGSSTQQSVQSSSRGSNQQMAQDQTWSQWWNSWWSSDQTGRTSTGGTSQLLRLYDRNRDGFLARQELPARMHQEFASVDRNRDGYLSQTEVRQNADVLRSQMSRSSQQGSKSQGSNQQSVNNSASRKYQNDQTWSEWWASWWADDSHQGTRDQIASSGASEFIRRHDQNHDGKLVRSEMPDRMYDEFSRIDDNSDRYLTRDEIRDFAQSGQMADQYSRRSDSQSRSGDQSRTSRRAPQATYVWIVEVDQKDANFADLQEAYSLLSEMDRNNDGQLSRSEFDQHKQTALQQFCEQRFDKLDQNEDGKLSRQEASDSLFGRDFAQFDDNDDDQLTQAEVRQAIEQKFDADDSTASSADSSRR